MPGTLPWEGRLGHVQLNGIDILLKRDPGSYEVIEAVRFGPKYTLGSFKYTDFNDYESAHNIDQVLQGYGLRRYSDVGDDQQQIALSSFKESTNIDSRFGATFLAPLQTAETLPSSTAPVVWFGQFTPSSGALSGVTKWVAVAGTKVYYRASNGTWTDTGIALGANAVQGAVGVFAGNLIIGMGAGAVGVYTTDLATTANVTNSTPTNIYIFKFVADKAAMFVVGGTATTATNSVTSGTTVTTFSTSPTAAGDTSAPITALLPGGGISLLYVVSQRELGEIDSNNVYHDLIPFDRQNAFNGLGARWWFGNGGDEQRGPVVLEIPADQDLIQYTPNTQFSGQSQNQSVWAKPGYRPPTVKGRTTAIQGTSRFLYHSIVNKSGESYVLTREAVTGNTMPLLDLGANTCTALGYTSGIFTGNPLMFAGQGNNVVSWKLPQDGHNPLDDNTCTFAASGTIDYPDIDLSFPDEDKIGLYIRVTTENVVAGAQEVQVWGSQDGSTYTQYGTVTDASQQQDIPFPTNSVFHRFALRLVLTTNDSSKTPVVLGISVRMRLNPRLYRIWHFFTAFPYGEMLNEAQDQINWETQIEQWWQDRKSSLPEPYTDIWGANFTVAVMYFKETHTPTDNHRVPEGECEFMLLEIADGSGNATYNDPLMTYNAPWATYS